MNNTTMTGGEARHRRRLFLLGILLLMAAVTITGGRFIYSRMQRARMTQDRPADLQWGTKIYNPATAGKAQDVRAKYLAKAETLRDHWRVWAVEHQELLRQLKQAPPGDTAALMKVYAALPYHLNKFTGVTPEDTAFDVDAFHAGRAVQFTWQPHALKSHLSAGLLQSDPHAQATSDMYDRGFLKKLQRDFASYHDIMLSESMSPGRSRITLWADGRITEMVRQDQHVIGKPAIVDGPEKETVPAYDFLK